MFDFFDSVAFAEGENGATTGTTETAAANAQRDEEVAPGGSLLGMLFPILIFVLFSSGNSLI